MARTVAVTRSMVSASLNQVRQPPGFDITLDCGHAQPAPDFATLGQDVQCTECTAIASAAPGLPA